MRQLQKFFIMILLRAGGGIARQRAAARHCR